MPNASTTATFTTETDKPTKLTEIVEDILKQMSAADKATVMDTIEDDLIQFHDSWGMGIRDGYNLWHDKALVKELGADHPDDALMIIIKAVWKALQHIKITNALKSILENYSYLKYEKEGSKRWEENRFKIIITDREKIYDNNSIACEVRDTLCRTTGINFPIPSVAPRQPYFYISHPDRYTVQKAKEQ